MWSSPLDGALRALIEDYKKKSLRLEKGLFSIINVLEAYFSLDTAGTLFYNARSEISTFMSM